MPKLLIPLVVLAASAVFAESTRIAVSPFKGAEKAHKQIESSLCKAFSCVKPGKSHKEEVSAVVTGEVSKKGKKKYLEVSLFTSSDSEKAVWHKKYGLQSGKLGPKALSSATKGLKAAIKKEKAEEEKDDSEDATDDSDSNDVASKESDAPVKSKAAASASDDAFASDAPKAAPARAPVKSSESALDHSEAKEESSDSDEAAPVLPPTRHASARESSNEVETSVGEEPSVSAGADPMVALEAGSRFFSRDLSYNNPTTPIRAYKASLLVAPAVHGEFYPLRGSVGLGLVGEYSMAVGTKTKAGSGDVTYPTSVSRADIGARLNFHASPQATLSALAGYRMADFSVSAAADGSTLSAMPAISYRAIRVGAGGQFAVSDAVSIFAEGAFLPVLSTGEIGSDAYFSGARASGLEAAGGLKIKIGNGFDVMAMGEYTRYGLSFTHVDGAQYQADGASDQYLGGSLRIRYEM